MLYSCKSFDIIMKGYLQHELKTMHYGARNDLELSSTDSWTNPTNADSYLLN